ncbi:lycopene cyclase domain-containing protein [Corynebacterium crudilactis]|uniref:C50 carotenoid epsilon cyclase n=1 Tax=Corynebacterium crudilactis TaxID=1652495 RepID=A0A172QRJ0_9CORY|nr:lycopene cyclase domain-containing protein [Corynebacterium crudilactis]ANE03307.1 C50 carotenoid epsilon cyclase [Corynebacterium crudilactis]
MSFIYLGSVLVLIGCMAICDHRWKLAFFRHPVRAIVSLGAAYCGFLLWDIFGIITGTFYRGDSAFMSGINLAPHMPIEELFFLFFLCYITLNLTSAVALLLKVPLPKKPEKKSPRSSQSATPQSTITPEVEP